jgi:hypothetical protein
MQETRCRNVFFGVILYKTPRIFAKTGSGQT